MMPARPVFLPIWLLLAATTGVSTASAAGKTRIDTEKPASRSIFAYNNDDDAGDDQGAEDSYPEEEPTRERRRRSGDGGSMHDGMSGRWGLSGGVGLGDGFFAASLSLAYYLNRFMAIDTSGFYRKEEGDNWSKIHYGPEVDLRLSLANPTLFVPFVGAGPGYEKWQRTYEQQTIDDSASLTANYFAGLLIKLGQHVSLQIARRTTTYLGDPPISLSDRKSKEATTFSRIEIGFQVSI